MSSEVSIRQNQGTGITPMFEVGNFPFMRQLTNWRVGLSSLTVYLAPVSLSALIFGPLSFATAIVAAAAIPLPRFVTWSMMDVIYDVSDLKKQVYYDIGRILRNEYNLGHNEISLVRKHAKKFIDEANSIDSGSSPRHNKNWSGLVEFMDNYTGEVIRFEIGYNMSTLQHYRLNGGARIVSDAELWSRQLKNAYSMTGLTPQEIHEEENKKMGFVEKTNKRMQYFRKELEIRLEVR